ncbi:Flavodoxin [Peptoclostridium litorale DSM 5388]|uniref:Flavodoxin n=1 Tax=Peptoclostridium litorale DSM 5388 TaxID=1121324 RepID=A0A069RDF1_PEPLI|nr:flavodoxin family protein [Peptoclostridium litorale]KDR95066.1 flavodoxin [Peptoclostridium litorale DSM 5388]SIN75574.1 Flavodoxin [Peptoclostridium litorale DSM 5388]
MNALIICESVHHDNTYKIAKVIAEAIGAKLCRPDEVEAGVIETYDLIGFGSGIYYGKHHEKLYRLIEDADIKGKNVFVFSTSGMGKETYNKALIDYVESKGANVKGSFACKGYDTYSIFKLIGGIAKGHPDDMDMEKAKSFAKTFIESDL